MIDVHTLAHPTQDRRASTLRLGAQLESEPVAHHVTPGKILQLGAARAEGFSRGVEPYVSFVDDDDEIVPGIFDEILTRFDQEPDLAGVCTEERIVGRDGEDVLKFRRPYYRRQDFRNVHHLVVYRRDAVLPHLAALAEIEHCPEPYLACAILCAGGKIAHLPRCGYVWYRHAGGVSSSGLSQGAAETALYKHAYNIQ